MRLMRSYAYGPNDKYKFMFNMLTGASLRVNSEDENDDWFYSEHGPELLDVCITEMCNKNCAYCYQDSKFKEGSHIDLDLYRRILGQTKHSVVQVALGGGEPTIHPKFKEILRTTREDFDIVPNYTTNGLNITPAIVGATKSYCGAVAVSAHDIFLEEKRYTGACAEHMVLSHTTEHSCKKFISYECKTNIHFILSSKTIKAAIRLLKTGYIPDGLNAIVFLLFKPVGRGTDADLLRKGEDLDEFIDAISNVEKLRGIKVGFDACSIPFVSTMTDFEKKYFDTCEGGRFSGYVHWDGTIKACSFQKEGYGNIKDDLFMDVWNAEDGMGQFRSQMLAATQKCKDNGCTKFANCMGGCPIAPQITLCSER